MSNVVTSGPKPSALQRTRRTKVARHAYWVPFDNGGDGGWRYLPIDRAHSQQVEGVDELGNTTRAQDIYTSKGFMPVEMVQDDEALAQLPVNWREHAMRGEEPVYAADVKADKAETKDSPKGF